MHITFTVSWLLASHTRLPFMYCVKGYSSTSSLVSFFNYHYFLVKWHHAPCGNFRLLFVSDVCVCVSIMWLPQSPGDGSSPQTLHPSHVSDGITALGTHWLTAGEKGRERSLKQRLHSTHTHTEDLWCIFYTHTPLNTHAYAIYACVCVCVT